ncbi:glycosyltransferase family 4 protein [Bacillus sp. DX4.1]|uniref:glycosyltransferase family 4 protein n=1 Tax=Bacillus sp. DX4.1 TaxID=3055867 RepID=UPI0025A12C91|nr:glycosyltransferase family 4 protein [Bacillus sp. DX4.1]MDM5190877.1 glycosyltransferase family 4 protein [Bacillus sp. DX4.1]
MKVFIFSSVHPWNDTRVFYKETVSLAKKGYEVKLCAVQNNVKYEDMYENLTIEYLPKVKRLARPFLWLRLFIKALREKADVYHFHDPELLVVGYFLKVFTKSKVIYDMHEDFPAAIKSKPWIPKIIRGKLSSVVGYMEKFLIKKCDAVIYAEKYYKNNYEDIDIIKEDILNYPLDNKISINVTKNKVPNIVYAGAISKTRGLHEMLKVAKELKKREFEFKMILIGNFSEQLKKETTDFIITNNLNEYIELPGRLPLHKVFGYYAQADIGLAILHPEKNYLQSLATKIFEYMSFGIPVVASNFPDWTELIEDSESGIVVDPFNIEEITDSVHKILSDRELSIQFGENGFKAYQEQFNWKVEEKKLIKLYESILGGN